MGTFTAWTGEASKALRLASGMTQLGFATELGVGERTVNRWERGGNIRPIHQAALDTMLARADDAVRHTFRQLRTDTQEDEVDRRKFLLNAALGAGGLATLGVADNPARTEWLLSGAGRPDAWALGRVRSTLYEAMHIDDALGSPAAQGMVIAQQQLTEALLQSCPESLRNDLIALHGEWLGFAGCLAWDQGDHPTAARLYNQGRDLAHEADDTDGAGYMLAHLSQLALWQKQPRIAVDHAVAAQSWVARSADLALRAYVSMRAAEAYATAGQETPALAALDAAERDLARVPGELSPSDSRAYFATTAILWSFRGECLALLGQHVAAVAASRKAVDAIPLNRTRDRALVLLELERGLLALGDVDEAAAAVEEAVKLTDHNRSPRLAKAIAEGRRALSPWAATSAVRKLDAALAERDMVLV
ncbi:helix-turn-helix domain-containing protein [Nocardia cyriacigeorgica]|uniref:helix-turn-helix domain-containing protein n=1 Tax=Nocardia cyriacigeorgica TaxID=135487 RepID=UPI001893D25E|nr:helix-turn-helix domain-containing protein [Nocardia cyriacigeorgica]MBF6326504.1 helix-turn-helix domain-containing protein [Nocardia cyriacigeorgica]